MKIIVIAGPNGAGKTTFAQQYLERGERVMPFVNGDDIAAELNPRDPAAAALAAGRIVLRRIEAHVAAGEDFAVETTLSGKAYARRIGGWQAAGYRVTIIYLRLPSADQVVARVARRVSEGGHHIPEHTARRRFQRSWANFRGIYREIADQWQVYDNSVRPPVLLAESESWREVREPLRRPLATGVMSERDSQYATTGRKQMADSPRFPEGEPSVKSVLAALERAQRVALARAAAVEAGSSRAEVKAGVAESRERRLGKAAVEPSDRLR